MTDATSFAKCTIQEKDFFKDYFLNTCRHIWYLFSDCKGKKLHVRIFRIEEVG